MPDIYGNPTEADMRGQQSGYAPNTLATAATPMAQNTYTNGHFYAGTKIPMSDAAYALLSNNGTRPIATTRDISGTGGVGQSLSSAAKFEADHIGNIFEGLTDPTRIFGIDPLTTKFGNAVFGTNNEPLVNQMGGATSKEIRDYENIHGINSAGGAQGLHNAAAGTTAVIAAGTLANGGLTGGQGGGAPTQLYQGGYNGNFATQTLGAPEAVGSGAGASAGAGLPEIVVTGTAPGAAGLTAGQIAGIGAGVGAGAGALAGGGGGSSYPGNYGDAGGFNEYGGGDLSMGNAADYGAGNAGTLANSGAIGGNVANSSLWDDLVPLAGQLLGSYLDGKGAKDASRAQVAATMAGLAEQRRQYDTSRADQMPWLTAGSDALKRLQDPNAFTTSPGYNFVRSEGNRDLNNSFAARGGALSGNALRATDQYNTNLASQEYNNWFNQNASLAGIGQASAQSLGALGQNNANYSSNLLTNQGNARASGILGQSDAYSNGLNQVGQWYGNYRRSRQGAY